MSYRRLGAAASVAASTIGLSACGGGSNPALTVRVVSGHDDELVSWAREGIVDVAVEHRTSSCSRS